MPGSAERTAIATVCLSGTLEDKLAAAASAGFDGVELFEPDLVASPLSPGEVRVRCADLGLTIELYQPFRDPDSTDADRFAASLLRAARARGCRTLDGGRMAVHQAVEAFRLFTGVTPDTARMLRHFAELTVTTEEGSDARVG